MMDMPDAEPRMQRFSTRTAWDTGESVLSAALRQAHAAGRQPVDLTLSNPTRCGFRYDTDMLLEPLGDPEALLYKAEPFGTLPARRAVVDYYAEHGASVEAEQVMLTVSTSEAYSHLFRLLCDAGDEVLVPQPSYPLFDFLADVCDVHLRPYPLFEDFGWWIDTHALESRITPRSRAVLLVHPNNPTGHATGAAERRRVEEICARHGLALIVDEVFLDFPLEQDKQITSFATGEHPCLCFVLSGLSKVAALPQMKVGWAVCLGPGDVSREALGRLEVIADTFLSLNAPAQLALPRWLESRRGMVPQILERLQGNLRVLQSVAEPDAFQVLRPNAGWSAVLKLARPVEEHLASLIIEGGVVLHPGSFYGFSGKNRAVVSLLGPAEAFAEGVRRLSEWCRRG